MPDSKWRQKGNNTDPSCPKPVFTSASKHLNSVNTKPLPVCSPCSQLGHSKQLTGSSRRAGTLWQRAPSIDLWLALGSLGIHPRWLKTAGCLQDFWRRLNICNFFPNIYTLSMSICLHLQVSSSMETTRAWASIRLNYFSNHITFGRLPFAKPKHLQLRNVTSKFKNFAKKWISSHRSGWQQSSKSYCCE